MTNEDEDDEIRLFADEFCTKAILAVWVFELDDVEEFEAVEEEEVELDVEDDAEGFRIKLLALVEFVIKFELFVKLILGIGSSNWFESSSTITVPVAYIPLFSVLLFSFDSNNTAFTNISSRIFESGNSTFWMIYFLDFYIFSTVFK